MSANCIVRARSAKNYKTFPALFQQYLETMYKSPKHDQIVAVNVMLTIIKAKCCTIDIAAPHCITHDKTKVNVIKAEMGAPSTQQGVTPKWKSLGGVVINFKDFIFNLETVEILYKNPQEMQNYLNRELTEAERQIEGSPMKVDNQK